MVLDGFVFCTLGHLSGVHAFSERNEIDGAAHHQQNRKLNEFSINDETQYNASDSQSQSQDHQRERGSCDGLSPILRSSR